MPDFREKFNAIISSQFGIGPERILPELRFKEDLGADSLDIAELMTEIEDAFTIYISDSEVDGIKTIGEALDCIREKLEQQDDSPHRTVL